MVCKLLELSANPFVGNPDGHLILHRVINTARFSFRAMTMLLERDCDPRVQDRNGQTVLHVMAKRERDDVVQFLDVLISHIPESDRVAFVNTADREGKSAIYYAAGGVIGGSFLSMVCKLLELSANPFVGNPDGHLILHRVINTARSSLRAMTMLLERDCDPRVQDIKGQTVLHVMANIGSPIDGVRQFLDVLISHIAESDRVAFLNTTDREGKSAIYYALTGKHNSFPMAVRLLELSADPFVGNPDRTPILHAVIRKDQTDTRLVEMLLAGHHDPTARDENGQTSLHILANIFIDFNRYVDTLISYVPESQRIAFVNATDREGKSAIYYTVRPNVSPYRICKLLELSADPSVGNPDDISILLKTLQLARNFNERDSWRAVTMLLLEGRSDPNDKDQSGQTPLHIVARKERLRHKSTIVRTLLESGADPTISDSEGYLPVSYFGEPLHFDSGAVFLLIRCMIPWIDAGS